MKTEMLPLPTTAEPQPARARFALGIGKDHVILWPYLLSIVFYHVMAAFAMLPWLFSWIGLGACLAGTYLFGTLGINLCYHRLLTHRGFKCSRRLEHFLALIGVCCLQDTPAHWVAVHRKHHQHSDEPEDPHSPLVTFLWAHFAWVIVEKQGYDRMTLYDRYAKDILRDPLYFFLERKLMWVWVNLAQWVVFYLAGFGIGWAATGSMSEGVRMGLSLWIWGVFARTVMVWHITWSVNSVAHLWGYRNYETGEGSRNNWIVGLLSNGEGWHNNHHAQPRAAAHGHRWWEFDVTYLTICFLERLGLVWDVVRPSRQETKAVA